MWLQQEIVAEGAAAGGAAAAVAGAVAEAAAGAHAATMTTAAALSQTCRPLSGGNLSRQALARARSLCSL